MATSPARPSALPADIDWRGVARLLVALPPWQETGRVSTLSVRHRVRDGFRVLELSGESDIATLPLLEAALGRAVPAAGNEGALVVDVSALTFCDVRSATLILEAGRTVRTSLAGACGVVERVFGLVDTSGELARCESEAGGAPAAPQAEAAFLALRTVPGSRWEDE